MSFFCSSNFQFSYSQIDKVTYVTSCYRLTPACLQSANISHSMHLELVHRVCDGAGHYSACSQIVFDDYSGFYEMRRTIILDKQK